MPKRYALFVLYRRSLTPAPSPKEMGVVCLKGIESMGDRKRGKYVSKMRLVSMANEAGFVGE